MKEMLIAFILALVIGSIYNQLSGQDPSYPAQIGDGTSNTAGGGSPNGGSDANGGTAGSGKAFNQQTQAGLQLVADVDEGSFQGMVLDSSEPVLVEFYTDQCPHCVTMTPILGQLAYDGQGVMRIVKINGKKNPGLAERYQITGVPAFILFSQGHQVDATSGAFTMEGLRAWLSQNNVNVPVSVGATGNSI